MTEVQMYIFTIGWLLLIIVFIVFAARQLRNQEMLQGVPQFVIDLVSSTV
jgi:hypothetical protein